MHLDQVLHPAAPIVTFALDPRRALLQQPTEAHERQGAWPDVEPLTRSAAA
jgi:hypothetical protein